MEFLLYWLAVLLAVAIILLIDKREYSLALFTFIVLYAVATKLGG